MQENKDPAITLFGKKIQLKTDVHIPSHPIIGNHLLSSVTVKEVCCSKLVESEEDDDEEEETEDCSARKASEDDDDESTNLDNENPKTPSIDEETSKPKTGKFQNDDSEKELKKPDKILPCPRCKSMDTKFCYYNNYNINQPRHFCKACQRYWTAGGTMRNVPVGAGRRKNKNSASHYRHITITEALQAAARNGLQHPGLKSNGSVLSFGFDSPICDSMASVLNLADKTVLNGTRNGFHHSSQEQEIRAPNRGRENGDVCSSSSSVSNPMEEGGRIAMQEKLMQNVNGFPTPIPCLPGVPWPYPWNTAAPPPAFCPPGFPMSFYPPAFWNCTIPGTWNIPFLPPQSSPNQKASTSSPNSPTLGKHSRGGDILNSDNREKDDPPKEQNARVLVPKTLRIDDPSEAAKSSIWATLGIKNESISGGGMFKGFQPKNDEKNHIIETSQTLMANPAALSRSLNFHESS